jgi:hypothetical protein
MIEQPANGQVQLACGSKHQAVNPTHGGEVDGSSTTY